MTVGAQIPSPEGTSFHDKVNRLEVDDVKFEYINNVCLFYLPNTFSLLNIIVSFRGKWSIILPISL